jgi:hypothetical protein
MGTRNRERRKVKQRSSAQRARRHERRPASNPFHNHAHNPFRGMSPEEIAELLMAEAVRAICAGDSNAVDTYVDALIDRPGDEQWCVDVNKSLLAGAQAHVGAAWVRGWQPADVERLAQRRLGAVHARVLVDIIAAQMRRYAAPTVDKRWSAQLDSLGAATWWDRDESLVQQWGSRESLSRADVLRCVLQVRHMLHCLPDIGRLCPPPGEAHGGSPRRDVPPAYTGDQRMLDRVRALLAKAESTEFAEEAEALTAKAQELMARHSIDDALLAARSGGLTAPQGIRLGLDNPYEAAKALLLQNIAVANRCQTVWSKSFGFCTVVGFETDLGAVELLYTSLRVQATTAMLRSGVRRDAYGRSRTRSFRTSFLEAFAVRIGERLRGATDDASQQAAAEEGADKLLPVLAAREDHVRAAVKDMFPSTTSSSVRISNWEGWTSGRAAANIANIHARREVGDEQ